MLLEHGYIVDFGIGVQPLEVGVEVCKGTPPVYGVLQLIFDLGEPLGVYLDLCLSLCNWIDNYERRRCCVHR